MSGGLLLCKKALRPSMLTYLASVSTDIMVESPDEHSIVTYVAQFLEHFPELEGVSVYCYGTSLLFAWVYLIKSDIAFIF